MSVENTCAQSYKISGKVTESGTNTPIPYASVVLKGSLTGTTTNNDGYYEISAVQLSDSIIVSFLGYKSQTKAVSKKNVQTINFSLESSQVNLSEFVVKGDKKEINPAHVLLDSIENNKKYNNYKLYDYYEYEAYKKSELDLNNISEDFKNKKFLKQFQFVFDNIDTSLLDNKAFVPVLISEAINEHYYRKEPFLEKNILLASKTSGIKNESLLEYINGLDPDVNIYENYIILLGKTFISPFASSGKLFYRYYIKDTVEINNKQFINVDFFPRRDEDLAFKGEYTVSLNDYAIKSITMSLGSTANINWVQSIFIKQDFKQEQQKWFLSSEEVIIDFTTNKGSEKSIGLYGKRNTSFKKINYQASKDEKFYSKNENIILSDAYVKDDRYWTKSRHDSLSTQEENTYAVVERLEKLPVFMSYKDLAKTILSGWQTVGMFELGPYLRTLSYNPVDGYRMRMGLRTNKRFNKYFRPEIYVAIGNHNPTIRYGAGFLFLPKKDPRFSISFNYVNDLEQLGLSPTTFEIDHIIGSALARYNNDKLSLFKEANASIEKEWIRGLSNTLSFSHKTYYPMQYLDFSAFGGTIINSELSLNTRISFKEKIILGDFERLSMGTKYPVINIKYSMGIPGIIGSSFNYQRININMLSSWRMGPIGSTKLYTEVHKTWGALPFILQTIHYGNERYTLDHYSFNLMNFYEFVSDEYLIVYLTHYFDGLFLNKIPLFKKLQLRELVWSKCLMGNFSDANLAHLALPNFTHKLKEPYWEIGTGIENILKVLRIDVIWRLSYFDHTEQKISKIGLRGSLQVKF
jgi:hypothetical protein